MTILALLGFDEPNDWGNNNKKRRFFRTCPANHSQTKSRESCLMRQLKKYSINHIFRLEMTFFSLEAKANVALVIAIFSSAIRNILFWTSAGNIFTISKTNLVTKVKVKCNVNERKMYQSSTDESLSWGHCSSVKLKTVLNNYLKMSFQTRIRH